MSRKSSKVLLRSPATELIAAACILGWGAVDWLTGPEISLSAFYLPPIAAVAWFSGRGSAVLVASLAALTWYFAEVASSAVYSSPLIPFWNALIRLIFFLSTALLTAEVRIRKSTEAELRAQRNILSSVLNSMGDGVLVVGNDNNVITFNPAAAEIFSKTTLGANALDWLKVVKILLQPAISAIDPFSSADSPQRAPYGTREVSLKASEGHDFRRLALTALHLVSEDGKGAGSVMVIADLTTQRQLEKQISQVIEREQRRIGQDLHDGVCQHLVGVAFASASLQAGLEDLGLHSHAVSAGEIATLINIGIGQARGLAHGLYPVGLEEGLETALSALATNMQKRSGIECRFEQHGQDFQLDPESAVHLYRIAQESVNNALSHASATSILISLSHSDQELELRIRDDGEGIRADPSTVNGIGHHIMRHRANILGGKLEVFSELGKGTSVICNLTKKPVFLPDERIS